MQHQPKNIVAILGSTRQQSVNRIVLQSLKSQYADDLAITIFDRLDTLPHFNPDLLGTALPATVKAFYELINQADGVIICSPEYVFSIPGVLKNAIEWTVSTVLFSDKPVAIIVASSLGEKTFESLSLVMSTLGVHMPETSKLLISGSNSKVNADNTLQPDVLDLLNSLMLSFINSINTPAKPAE
jgi:chromate reductase